ncbi:MAG: hypothetical protein V2I33_03570 [Kangiellaceae bacterium]|jgi:hypothetical protein|nr:hypothetical protein [Kangiellaceae bacterium]
MERSSKLIVGAVSTILLASSSELLAFAASSMAKDDQPVITVRANKIYEQCLPLKSKQQIKFSFNTSDISEFNIHYHDGDDVYYPVARQNTNKYPATIFTATEANTYCLMWSNFQNQSIELSFTLDVLGQ